MSFEGVAAKLIPEKGIETVAFTDPRRDPHSSRRFYARTFRNPSAQLYWAGHKTLCCGLSGQRAHLLNELEKRGTLKALERKRLVAPFEVIPNEYADYAMTFRITPPPRISYCHEWPTQMWKSGCLHLLNLMGELAADGLTVRYPHPWHLLFDGPSPVYIHLGSIAPLDEDTFRTAFDRLSRFFLRPLSLAARGYGVMARRFLGDMDAGVDQCVADLASAHAMQTAELARMSPMDFLKIRTREVEQITIPQESSRWSTYQRDLPLKPTDSWSRKEHMVYSALRTVRPREVLDLGCNLGWHARLASIEGADAVAADLDEECVNRVYSRAVQDGIRVLPLVLNITDPAPGHGLANIWLPPATERLRSELVLALAIMHHLVFGSHRLLMNEVVAAFSAFTSRALLAEYVPLNSPGCVYSIDHRPDAREWYTLEHCIKAFGSAFRQIDILPGAQGCRRLLLCQR